jgi:hypothetical protein
MKVRTAFLVLLLVTLLAVAYYLLVYIRKHSKAGEPGLALKNYFLTYATRGSPAVNYCRELSFLRQKALGSE